MPCHWLLFHQLFCNWRDVRVDSFCYSFYHCLCFKSFKWHGCLGIQDWSFILHLLPLIFSFFPILLSFFSLILPSFFFILPPLFFLPLLFSFSLLLISPFLLVLFFFSPPQGRIDHQWLDPPLTDYLYRIEDIHVIYYTKVTTFFLLHHLYDRWCLSDQICLTRERK